MPNKFWMIQVEKKEKEIVTGLRISRIIEITLQT